MFYFFFTVPTLQEMCLKTIVNRVNAFDIDSLPLPHRLKSYLKSFSSTIDSKYSFQKRVETLKKQKSKQKRSKPRKLSLGKFNRLLSPFSSHRNRTHDSSHSHDQCVIC